MNCPRCQGLIVREYQPSEAFYVQMRPVHRCVNCGFRNDLVYNLNRETQKKGVRYDC